MSKLSEKEKEELLELADDLDNGSITDRGYLIDIASAVAFLLRRELERTP